jgi:RNA polymerase sigma-70 factor (ECF subfamily)
VDAERGLESLYRKDGERLWRAVAAYTGDREIANDAVAEAFAQALARGSALRDPMAWIWRVAFRVAAGELKDRTRGGGSAPEAIVGPEEPLTDLLAALRALSPKQRAAVVLHHYAGYPVKEVAGIIGSTSAAVRVHLSQGRKRLRGLLEAHDG